MSQQFVGVWKNVPESVQGFDEFMDALNIDQSRKDTWRNLQMTTEYQLDGNEWTAIINVSGRPNPRVMKFKSGEPFEAEGFQGQIIKSTINVDGAKMSEIQYNKIGSEERKMHITREVNGDVITVTTTVEGKTMSSKLQRHHELLK